MRLPPRVQQFLDKRHIPYDLLVHVQVDTPQDAAAHGYIALAHLAHAVLLADRRGPLLAVIPANQHLDVHALNRQLQRDAQIVAPQDARELFSDCDLRALPPFGGPYGVKTIVDERLFRLKEIYFQPGLGTALVQMSGRNFETLMHDAWHGFQIATGLGTGDADNSRPHLDLKSRLRQIDELPAMPAMARRILQVRANPYADARELAQVIELDPSLSAQIMRYARAPFFGYTGPLNSVQDAIARVLGYDMVMNISLGIATGKPFRMQSAGPLGLASFWRHAVYCAALTQNLANALPLACRPSAGLAYLAGLLHNFGHLALGHLFKTEFFWLNKQVAAHPEVPVIELERRMLQSDHMELGALLLETWQLPGEILVAVRHHHDPNYRGEHSVFANLVLIANHLLADMGISVDSKPDFPAAVLTNLDLSNNQSETILGVVQQGKAALETMARQLAA